MLNAQKVEYMSKLALYEHSKGKKTLKLNKYFKSDFKASAAMRSVPFGILSYLLILAAVLLVDTSWLVNLSGRIGIFLTAALAFASLVVFVVLYCIISSAILSHQYEDLRSSLREYSMNLRGLDRAYDKEKQDSPEE
ncbi:MAG: hypothetical protein IKH67_03050 [Lachnospiraceae bacterium]|nr:hypothetical protein [Lachnospiraceae bacterium]MBR3004033.1 hypothetical protein [Lachnospiraceae bacterium]MBR6349040.1 hypothetical protein [Lachnospiraceae bacterium]